jgi:hypothetical protein
LRTAVSEPELSNIIRNVKNLWQDSKKPLRLAWYRIDRLTANSKSHF